MDHTPAPIFRKLQKPPASSAPSSSPTFGTPAHPPKPFSIRPPQAAVLPIILPSATLRPLAFRTFTKKHGLTLTSSALQELAGFIGRNCGSGWREEGLAERVLEEVARGWKGRNGGVMVEGAKLQEILTSLQGNMSGGKITPAGGRERAVTGGEDSLNTRLGLRPQHQALRREDGGGASFGLSGLGVRDDPDDAVEDKADVGAWLKVIDAHHQPRMVYSVSKKHFERDAAKPSLLPPASHKTAAFRNRYHVIHQRLLRNESFQSSSVTSSRKRPLQRSGSMPSQQSLKMTPIANLLGRHGSNHMLLGQLNVLPTGELAISDLTGTIALDVSQAVALPDDSAWFCPGMMVLVDGVYGEEEESIGKGLSGSSGIGGTLGGHFQGFFIGQPPCERRGVTLGVGGVEGAVGGGFGWVDFLGVGSERAVGARMRRLERRVLPPPSESQDEEGKLAPPSRNRIVIMGEVNLDHPRALQALRKILSLYAAEPEGTSPLTFVLAGNFTQHPVMARGGSGGSIEYKECFDALASALSDFPTLLSGSTFVFLPGDNDAWVSSFTAGASPPLPRKPIPDMFTSRVRRAFADGKGTAVWTSNPSRISLFGPVHELLLFRDDMSSRLRRLSVPLTKRGDVMDVDPPPLDVRSARKLVKSVLDQGYLSPFRQAVRPVHWDYASALHLYPLPTAMALVDTSAPPFCLTYEACHVMNPGSLLVPGKKGVARWVEYEIGRVGRVRECAL